MDEDTQMEDTVGGVEGTKRKRTELSKTKDGKYQCQQCDYENSNSSTLRRHEQSKPEGIRYPCDLENVALYQLKC